MTRLLILGGTGPTGRLLVQEALARKALLRESPLERTVLHAAMLVNGRPTGRHVIGDDLPRAGVRRIRRALVVRS